MFDLQSTARIGLESRSESTIVYRGLLLFCILFFCSFPSVGWLFGCFGFFFVVLLVVSSELYFFLSTTKSAGQVFRFFDFCYDNVIVMNMAIESKVSLVI